MKALTKLALVTLLLATAASAPAQTVRGYFRSSGTYVAPYYRTPANGSVYDNLSYRGYPSQQPGYVSPRSFGLDSSFCRPSYGIVRPVPLPSLGGGSDFNRSFRSNRNSGFGF
jgi:hypothetical protein